MTTGSPWRSLTPARLSNPAAALRLENLDFGDRLFGRNGLRATLTSGGPSGRYIVEWELAPPLGSKGHSEQPRTFRSRPLSVSPGRPAPVEVEYELTEPCPPYDQYQATLRLIDERRPEQPVAESTYWLATWTVSIDVELGGLYLPPDRREQFVRLNLGLTHDAMRQLERVRLEVIRRRDGTVVATRGIPAGPRVIEAQRDKIPNGLRGDLARLLLADLDVSRLPVLPFDDPQRNWLLRVTALDRTGKPLASADSAPFCRIAHDKPAPAIQKVTIDEDHLLYVNGKPWMPWGVVYGHVPTYAGPADPGEENYLDLGRLSGFSPYDRFTAAGQTRRDLDFNCLRYVAASITPPDKLKELWQQDNLYCSSAYCVPHPVFSMQQLQERAGGAAELNSYLDFCRTAPMVVSVAPGIEEAFGLFHGVDDQQQKGLAQAIDYVRRRSGKPVMVGHGGFWNRFEFEKTPAFDVYDPETEPLFPANLHTDLLPLIKGRRAVVWLRPQMYESVPYERWRFHTFVELMRGARGWQMAHGPGDRTLFRGLHGELRRVEP